MNKLEHGTPYVIIKNGMYYAHNSCGYVHRVLMAELYTEKEALASENQSGGEIKAVPLTDCLSSSDEVQEYLDRIIVMRDAMKLIEGKQAINF